MESLLHVTVGAGKEDGRLEMRKSLLTAFLGLTVLVVGPLYADPVYVNAVLADNPVAYWRMSETSGAATANSANLPPSTDPPSLLDGTLVNQVDLDVAGPQPPSYPGFLSANAAADFDGLGDYIRVTDPGTGSVLDFGSGDSITMEAWVNPNSLPTYDTVVGKGRTATGSTNQNYALRVYGSGDSAATVAFVYRSTDSKWNDWRSNGSFLVDDGGWHHVALTFTWDGTGNSIAAYIDGEPSSGSWYSGGGYGSGTSDPYQDNDQLWIGSARGGDAIFSFDGLIDEVAVYRSGLSADRIKAHYDAAVIPEPTSVLFFAGTPAVMALRRRRRTTLC